MGAYMELLLLKLRMQVDLIELLIAGFGFMGVHGLRGC